MVGNHEVQFGPGLGDNFIQKVDGDETIQIRRKGRSFVMDVEMVKRMAMGFHGQA